MNPLTIIEKYYDTRSEAYRILLRHSRSVADKALSLAEARPERGWDLTFIEEAAMLHDIGMIFCHAPDIDCHGTHEYICHGYLGADLLRKEGYPRHALVCERHTGTGITLRMIDENSLPLPRRDFVPLSDEERLICFADKFFSKTKLDREKNIGKIRESLGRYGEDTVARFDEWRKLFLG
ncbi:MAG: HDIG domain-containing protein [Tannerella sp.]|jgi:uncharacterized protein|nr:HDIG domain-containing protein [Tannerella sp.]